MRDEEGRGGEGREGERREGEGEKNQTVQFLLVHQAEI